LEAQNAERQEVIKSKTDHLKVAELEPGRLKRQISSIENARVSMDVDLRSIERAARRFDDELEIQLKRRGEAEKLRKTILEKLELNRQTLEGREQDVASVKANLDRAKAQTHDIMTKKYELTVRKREVDGTLRHTNDQLTVAEKDYEMLKRTLKKKRTMTDSVKQVLPSLDGQMKDQETIQRGIQDEKNWKMKEMKKFKDEVDTYLARFMLLEGIEADKKKELESSAADVDTLETNVLQMLNEGKRQGIFLKKK
jgi:chromosome segregation ATPase